MATMGLRRGLTLASLMFLLGCGQNALGIFKPKIEVQIEGSLDRNLGKVEIWFLDISRVVTNPPESRGSQVCLLKTEMQCNGEITYWFHLEKWFWEQDETEALHERFILVAVAEKEPIGIMRFDSISLNEASGIEPLVYRGRILPLPEEEKTVYSQKLAQLRSWALQSQT